MSYETVLALASCSAYFKILGYSSYSFRYFQDLTSKLTLNFEKVCNRLCSDMGWHY